jgi:hypothetical protein
MRRAVFSPLLLFLIFGDLTGLLDFAVYTAVLFAFAPLKCHFSTMSRASQFWGTAGVAIAVFSFISSHEHTSLATMRAWTAQSYWLYGSVGALCVGILAFAVRVAPHRGVILAKAGAVAAYIWAMFAFAAFTSTPSIRVSVHLHHWLVAWIVSGRPRGGAK